MTHSFEMNSLMTFTVMAPFNDAFNVKAPFYVTYSNVTI